LVTFLVKNFKENKDFIKKKHNKINIIKLMVVNIIKEKLKCNFIIYNPNEINFDISNIISQILEIYINSIKT
jgi:hypothetical protein